MLIRGTYTYLQSELAGVYLQLLVWINIIEIRSTDEPRKHYIIKLDQSCQFKKLGVEWGGEKDF